MLLHEFMILHDDGNPAWRADFQAGLLLGFLGVVLLAIATGLLALILASPQNELCELGQQIAGSQADEIALGCVLP